MRVVVFFINFYFEVGVDIVVGDFVVELMKLFVWVMYGFEVFGGVGGFVGLFDVSVLCDFCCLLLVISIDGVGMKVVIV